MAIASSLIEEKFAPEKESPRTRKRTQRRAVSAQLEAFNKGRGRAVIVGARKNSVETTALKAWLAGRIDVVRFEYRIGSGEFYVNYDDGTALPGRFIRSLRDKIHTLNRISSEPFDVTPVHSLKGRVRVRVTGIGERELATLTMLAGGLSGVKQTRHFRGGRTMLVEYDPKR